MRAGGRGGAGGAARFSGCRAAGRAAPRVGRGSRGLPASWPVRRAVPVRRARCGAPRVDPLVQLDADEGGGRGPGQPGRVGVPLQRGRRQQPGEDLLQLLDPQSEPVGGGGGEDGRGLPGGQQLPEQGDVPGGPFLLVHGAGELQQFGEAAQGGEAVAVAGHALLGAVPAGRGEQLVHGAEVVEDQALPHPGGGRDGACGGLGDALLGQGAQGSFEQLLLGGGAHARASSRTGRRSPQRPVAHRSRASTYSAVKEPS